MLAISAAANLASAEEFSLEDIAKLRANPLRGLKNVSLTEQVNFGTPSHNDEQNVVTLQPLWPVELNDKWDLILYPFLPLVSQEDGDGHGTITGLGNAVVTMGFTPQFTDAFIWALGPVVQLPTATNHQLGPDMWAAGPAAALFVEPDPWVVGLLLENIWSFAGSSDSKINFFSAEYFLTRNLPQGWFLQSNGTITSDWHAARGDQWTVPVGGGFGKVFTIGERSLSLSTQALYNAVAPANGPDWSVSLGIQFIFAQ